MVRVIRYYPGWCPRCGYEGEMFIAAKADGQLCFSCAECYWTCDRPEDIPHFERGYEGFKLNLAAPTRDQIEAQGWGQYCVHEEIQDVCQFCGVEFLPPKSNTCDSCGRKQDAGA